MSERLAGWRSWEVRVEDDEIGPLVRLWNELSADIFDHESPVEAKDLPPVTDHYAEVQDVLAQLDRLVDERVMPGLGIENDVRDLRRRAAEAARAQFAAHAKAYRDWFDENPGRVSYMTDGRQYPVEDIEVSPEYFSVLPRIRGKDEINVTKSGRFVFVGEEANDE